MKEMEQLLMCKKEKKSDTEKTECFFVNVGMQMSRCNALCR